ncbi:MAG: lytic transglycosylase domain-containing protein [Deltaproteobacteria bacterium]|nr:lytic transglycosylase domain-containing protein [Deltaproteobacteria bacterium]
MAFQSNRRELLILLLALAAPFGLGVSAPQETVAVPRPGDAESAAPYRQNTATDAHYHEISDAQLSELLGDPKGRVSSLFKVPRELAPDVGFWFRIYSKYSLYQTLLYDRERPDVIYDVIDVRDLFQKGKSAAGIEVTGKLRLKKHLVSLHEAFNALARNPKARFPAGSTGARLVGIWGRRSSKEWRRLHANVRAQTGQRDRIMQGIAAADPFIPAMEAIFRKYKLPTELVRIPLVESSFNTQATSRAAAVGVWQFLEESALEYLIVDRKNKIDERVSPIKSTYAAARMFQRNFKILGDYGLAVIAYNHGPKNLVKIRHKYAGANLVQLLKIGKRSPLGYASRNYYCEFLALLHAERYRDELYGMTLPENAATPAISIVSMKRPASIFEVSALYNISLYELKKYNPDIFETGRKLPSGTRIVIPRKVGESLVMAPAFDAGGSRVPASAISAGFEFVEYLK